MQVLGETYVFQYRYDGKRVVIGFEIGIVGQDLFPRRTGGLVTSPRPSSRYAVAATP